MTPGSGNGTDVQTGSQGSQGDYFLVSDSLLCSQLPLEFGDEQIPNVLSDQMSMSCSAQVLNGFTINL